MTMPNLDQIIAFEEGELDTDGVLELFGGLIASGLAWQLQGRFGRTANDLIGAGLISPEGEVLAEDPCANCGRHLPDHDRNELAACQAEHREATR